MMFRRILMLVIVLIPLAACGGEAETKEVPDNLTGVWKATGSSHQKRYFELKKTALIFGRGAMDYTVHGIRNLEVEDVTDDGKTFYLINYWTSDGKEFKFSFYYDSNRDVIRLRNQDRFDWVRAS